ncbi:hypothetical protein ACEQUB_01117 [Ralstonia syzygii]
MLTLLRLALRLLLRVLGLWGDPASHKALTPIVSLSMLVGEPSHVVPAIV